MAGTRKINGHLNRPIQGFAFNYMIDILSNTQEPIRTNKLFRKSKHKLRASFYKYLNWLIKKGYLEKKLDYRGDRKRNAKPLKHPRVYVKITQDGRKFLSMLK